MAQVLENQDSQNKRIIITIHGEPKFIWDYLEDKNVVINPELIPAISINNKEELILNKNAVIFPEKPPKSQKRYVNKELEEVDLSEGEDDDGSQGDEEESIIIIKLRELVLDFEELLKTEMKPQIPEGRRARKKYMEEREIFRTTGYKEYVIAIQKKVDALCVFENYSKKMFDGLGRKGWFDMKIEEALMGSYHSALEVVNSVEQIVKEDTYAVPQRKIISRIK